METQVLIGTLADLNKVKTEEGIKEVQGFQDRAMWSWLRLHHTKQIDQEIKKVAQQMKLPRRKYAAALEELILEHLIEASQQRPLQYIIVDGKIRAVATMKHLLIPPAEVEAVAADVLKAQQIQIERDPELEGIVTTTEEIGGLRFGFHVYPGDILTRKAISVSAYVFTVQCLNPLTWAGIGNFGRFGLEPQHERVLRIQKITELRPRLEEAVTEGAGEVSALKKMVDYAKTHKVDPKEAKVILSAFARSYGLGEGVIKEMLSQFDSEDKTTWGMSQAASYVARHGKEFRDTPEDQQPHARQSMAVVGAAALLIKEPKVTYEQAMKWLGGKWPSALEWLTL